MSGPRAVNGSGHAKVSHRKLGDAVAVSLSNEQTTRSRVDYLEVGQDELIRVAASHEEQLADHGRLVTTLYETSQRPFWGRVRWLVTGR
jgi:hypothetical protein